MTIAVFWFVFVFGLKVATSSGEAPFVAQLIVGLVAWFWLSDSVTAGAHAVTGSAYLVKKIAFPMELLPLAPVLGAFLVHGAIVVLISTGLALAGEFAGWRVLMLPYFMIGLGILAVGLAYWVSALNVFSRDVAQTTSMMLQVWFWLTPIVWAFELFPAAVSKWLRFNPMAYIVEGYRFSLLADMPAPVGYAPAVAFWALSTTIAASGYLLFQRLRSEFADVL